MERQLNVDQDRFLTSHVLNGDAVLPFALSMEWMAHGALHENPGLVFHGFNEVRLLKGVVLAAGRPYPIRVYANKALGSASLFNVGTELRGGGGKQETLHLRGDVLLVESLPPADKPRLQIAQLNPYPLSVQECYRTTLFHGKHFHAITEIEGISRQGIVFKVQGAPSPESLMQHPPRHSWITDPLVIDSAFQAAILWSYWESGEFCLPTFAASYRQFRHAFPGRNLRVVATAVKSGQHTIKMDFEFLDEEGHLVARLDGHESVVNPGLKEAFKRRSLEVAGAV